MARTGIGGNPILTNSSKRPQRKAINKLLGCGLTCILAISSSATAQAGELEQAKKIHDLLIGSPPSAQLLNDMATAIGPSPTMASRIDAANLALNDAESRKIFYNVTVKNMVTPWTNEEQTVFAPLNDYTATVIGMVRDDIDFRTVLYGDIIYTGSNINNYSSSNNNLYENLENNNADLGDPGVLVGRLQSQIPGPLFNKPNATAGIMTTRAAARAYFVDGTNRAMFRFTVLNHLCTDLEQLKDNTRPTDRIRRDVSRSPGGDSRLFMNNCVACHSGMDPMAQALARYQWAYTTDVEAGQLEYTPDSIQPKYHINSSNFKGGYDTQTDDWTNYWRRGPNARLGWNGSLPGSGTGAKSLGEELANSQAFATCQVKKVFKAVCMRNPQNAPGRDDTNAFNTMVTNFTTNGYHLKGVFAEAAAYCSSTTP